MSIVQPFTKLQSISARKKFGRPTGYGAAIYGLSFYGGGNELFGIYQQRHCKDGIKTVKMKFYRPSNPQTAAQQLNRGYLSSAVAAWQNLTNEQKQVYNRRAVGQSKSGYNIFIGEYISSST